MSVERYLCADNQCHFSNKNICKLLEYNLSNLQKVVKQKKQTWTTVEVRAKQDNAMLKQRGILIRKKKLEVLEYSSLTGFMG